VRGRTGEREKGGKGEKENRGKGEREKGRFRKRKGERNFSVDNS